MKETGKYMERWKTFLIKNATESIKSKSVTDLLNEGLTLKKQMDHPHLFIIKKLVRLKGEEIRQPETNTSSRRQPDKSCAMSFISWSSVV